MAADWAGLPDEGTELLIEPIAPALAAGAISYPLAGGPLGFLRVRVTVLRDGEILAEDAVEAAALADARRQLPGRLAAELDRRFQALTGRRPPLALASGSALGLDRPRLMGIVNVTPDSFSDGGRHFDPAAAIAHGEALLQDGADILDIGGESTRPGAQSVPEEEEARRILPVIAALASAGAIVSVDSRKASVQRLAIEAGAQIVNDVSALTFDPESLALAAASGAPVILMHAKGGPETMQKRPRYRHVLAEVFAYLRGRVAACNAAGIPSERIVIDPGIGFGKTVEHNLALIEGLAALHGLGCPILLGASRKRFISALAGDMPVDARAPGSIAAALAGVARGAQILRVHDVGATRQALAINQGLADTAALRHL